MENNYHFIQIKYLLFFFFVFLKNIKLINSKTCTEEKKLSNTDCFNSVLIFNNKDWRAGHSALNKDGVFILEFSPDSENGDRLFYGLKPNGRYYFPDEKPTKQVTLSSTTYNGKTIIARYESINSFIAFKDDTNRDKEYFLSISTYYCYMELYDFTKDEVEFKTKYTLPYLDNHIYSFKFDIFGTTYSGSMIYYLVLLPSYDDYDNHESGDRIFVKKIGFTNLEFNTQDIIASKPYTDKNNERMVSSFLVDDIDNNDFKILVVVFLNKNLKYSFNVYSLDDLSIKCDKCSLYGDNLDVSGKEKGYGLFFKILYLGNRDTAMTYFLSNVDKQKPKFQVLTIEKGDKHYFSNKIYYEVNYELRTDLLQNDFIKINNERLVFISSSTENSLFILLMDLYNYNYNVEMRRYVYDISPHKFTKEFSAHIYNNYLAFSSSINNNGKYSIFMIFGFGNGTDFILDISPYLKDTDIYTEGNNLVTRLLQNMTIDNNIFGYVAVNEIKIISYPEQLLVYSSDDESTLLPFGSNVSSVILRQNFRLNKTYQYYTLEYQYMVKEQDYDNYASYSEGIYEQKPTGNSDVYKNHFKPKTFWGRTNILYFKLCHSYCEKCNIYGTSNNYQRCFVCLPEYTYDYLTLLNQFINILQQYIV